MLKLLVADDERDVCDFVRNFFKERKFDVLIALDGREAVSVVERERPEIVLLDIKMPVLDGIDALRSIKGINNKTVIIMITAADDADKMDEARELGAVEYITKPLLLEQLERAVLAAAEEVRARK